MAHRKPYISNTQDKAGADPLNSHLSLSQIIVWAILCFQIIPSAVLPMSEEFLFDCLRNAYKKTN